MFSETLLIAAYGLVPVISTGAFVPQIVALAKSDGELKNFSFAAWSTWLLSAIISVFYGVFYLQDFMFILASSVACFFNVIIITLAAYKALGRPRFKIDYGPDENKPEADVLARIGKQALLDWDEHAIVPNGWKVDPDEIIQNWHDFADQIAAHDDDETVLVVTSNGIARFAPHITGDFETFASGHRIKLATGALGILKHEVGRWRVAEWNLRP